VNKEEEEKVKPVRRIELNFDLILKTIKKKL
jgi:hypothetical protein